jgi:hypothetical protein
MRVENAEQARQVLADYLGWPVECVPVPTRYERPIAMADKSPYGWAFGPEGCAVTAEGHCYARFGLESLVDEAARQGLPTPVQVVAAKDARIAELERRWARLEDRS